MTGLPRLPLASLPTPLQRLTRLGQALGIADLWVKRDDLTGFGFGGNKIRKLEFLFGDASSCDVIVVAGGPRSNLCLAAATTARVVGIECELVLYGERPSTTPLSLGLAEVAGASVSFTGDPDRRSVESASADRASTLRSIGRRPYLIPRGGATGVGAVGYHLAVEETVCQLDRAGVAPPSVVVAVGSGGTLGGLASGVAASDAGWKLVGATVSRHPEEAGAQVERLASACTMVIGGTPRRVDVDIVDARGSGYGRRWDAALRMSDLAMATEALVTDQVYTAKSLTALVTVADRYPNRPVLWWHTGGTVTALDDVDAGPA